MNMTLIIMVGTASVAFLILLIAINLKDRKKMETQLNNDYHKTKDHEKDLDID